ncbi:hypothetical protein [Deinococcus budaensis]|uniref:Uncharacterized protein n=1 Tax=Deinococcus budaensis TaxID=1665626 RepID=A0A7W8GFG8_9DEIO|nr:hypothetical protein [Deinococcus budaensis]MBB5234508.1 hypothetical protein [Deinococcus budaensis]
MPAQLTQPHVQAFDLVNWHVEDSYQRVEVTGPHSLTNLTLRIAGERLTYAEAHALATSAWTTGKWGEWECNGITVEPSWS